MRRVSIQRGGRFLYGKPNAAELANLSVGRPSEKASFDAFSDAQAAKLLNVSEPSVERAKAVRRKAISEVAQAKLPPIALMPQTPQFRGQIGRR